MSRIGKQPIAIPSGVTVKIADGKVVVKGPKAPQGLELPYHRNVTVELGRLSKDTEGARFRITDRSVDSLRAAEVPEAVLQKLEGLKEKWFGNQDQFLGELKSALSPDELEKHQDPVLEHARDLFIPDPAGNYVRVNRRDEERLSRSVHGLTRTLIANMVQGATQGYEKRLKIEGVGYGAKLDKKSVVLTVGFANQIILEPPPGVTAEVPDATTIIIRGPDKQQVGQFAAEVRHARPPEPYQGKGVRYENEVVRRKEGKSFTSGG